MTKISSLFPVTPGKGPILSEDISTRTCISRQPLLPDAWESSLVEARKSGIDHPVAGEGLFAKIDLSHGRIVALYNGIRLRSVRDDGSNLDDDGDSFSYRIRLNSAIDIDIPVACRHLDVYCATLAHKANHSFTPNARYFVLFETY